MFRQLALNLAIAIPLVTARRGGKSFANIQQQVEAETIDKEVASHGAFMVSDMVATLMDGHVGGAKGPSVHEIIASGTKHVNLQDAIQHVESHLPAEVASLVRLTTDSAKSSDASSGLDEAAIQRARVVFNNMVYQAEMDLTEVIFDCKEFQERNRGVYEQVRRDIDRLGSQIANHGEKMMKANQCIVRYDQMYADLESQLKKVEQAYLLQKGRDDIEMTRRRNDLAVFEFVMNVTSCKRMGKGKSFVQSENSGVRFCSTADDGLRLDFHNPALQAKVEKMMTPSARLALRAALGQITTELSLVQTEEETKNATFKEPSDGVIETSGEMNARKCTDMPEDPNRCAKVHDTLSIEWGRFRDEVDYLADQMADAQAAWENTQRNFNEQMAATNDAKTQCMEDLADSTGSQNADRGEEAEKNEQEHALRKEYETECAKFRKAITTILYEKICEIITVRNAVLAHSSKTTPLDTIDCELTDWKPADGNCIAPDGKVITCDDTCPRPDPLLCGGFESMIREVITAPNAAGISCGSMQKQKRCGQRKCPVDCHMSLWSGWSKCSRECEGGVQVKTRSILTKPKNGGMSCDTVQEPRPCNTGSCDRNCKLFEWTDWSFCSQACGGGVRDAVRKVEIPIRGNGYCPREFSPERVRDEPCNEQACAGDEVCIAQQDLIIALDASGSLREKGFEILKSFSVNLTSRYASKYYGLDAVKMGATTYGNGALNAQADGSLVIAPALKTKELTFDIPAVAKALKEVEWQKGFTNMAQALKEAEFLLARGGRAEAQSAVLVLSDGKPSFKYQTGVMAQRLKDQNIKVFMAPVVDYNTPDMIDLKSWASQPYGTHYERIPGFTVLEHNADIYMQKLIVKFCPDATSSALMSQVQKLQMYVMIREAGYPGGGCAGLYWEGVIPNRDECAEKAKARGNKAFVFGKNMAAGKCLSASMKVDKEYYIKYSKNHSDPECPGGKWANNPYYDTFALDPAGFE